MVHFSLSHFDDKYAQQMVAYSVKWLWITLTLHIYPGDWVSAHRQSNVLIFPETMKTAKQSMEEREREKKFCPHSFL